MRYTDILMDVECTFFGWTMRCTIYYSDVTMSAMAFQITGVSIVCSTVCSGIDKKTSKHRVTGLCEGNPPVTGGFHRIPHTRASNAENVSTWWCHHVKCAYMSCSIWFCCGYISGNFMPCPNGPNEKQWSFFVSSMLSLSYQRAELFLVTTWTNPL